MDDYSDVTLKKGTVLYGGYPGQSAYYMTEEAYLASGGSATALADGLQIMPSKTHTHPVSGPYRPQVRRYVVKEDTPAAQGPASANTQYGNGGLTQVFVPDYENSLDPVDTINLTP